MGGQATSKHAIIVVGEPNATKDEFLALAKEYEVAFLGNKSRPEVIAAIAALAAKGAPKYDAVVFLFGAKTGGIDKSLLGSLEGNLKYVGGIGAGYDTVDTNWLSSIGSWYTNTPDAVSDPTATTAVTLILQCVRHTSQCEATVRRGEWRTGLTPTPDVRGLVVGIVGMGTIGKLISTKVQALGMKVIYNNRHRLPAEQEGGATYVSFNELLQQSQLISLSCPLTPETYHLLSTKEFQTMRRGVIIVNTARGKVIDEAALVEALKSGQVDRAGLDVYENEPEINPYLLTSERCSLLPHWGSATVRIYRDAELEALDNVKDWIATGKPKHGVNKPVGQANL